MTLHKVTYILLSLVLLTISALATAQTSAQQHIKRHTTYFGFNEDYQVLSNDTTLIDGPYRKSYKGFTVEKGLYSNGQRTGVWEFYNERKMLELKYDYNLKQPIYILPHIGKTYSQDNYPTIFLGSSMVPFYLIMYNTYYPKAEADNKDGGTVTLALHIDEQGRMTGFDITNATTDNFARVVRQAAQKIPQDTWLWIPALKNGNPTADDYNLTIVFENQ